MYGISNSQQQGGGGGGAASYKAIKSTIAPSDWQEVAKQPYFVGENAMTWEVNTNTEVPTKSQSTSIGLVAGNSYTITIVADGQTYNKTATAEVLQDSMVILDFVITDNIEVVIYDGVNVSTIEPGTGSMCMVIGLATITTSFIITSFVGEGLAKTIQAAISDSAIKVNSAVTMYTNTSEKIAVGEKTNGNVTLTAPSIPNVIIPYSLEIVGTDTEGLFELVNGYIPDTPSGALQWNTIYEDTTGTGAVSVELSEPLQAGGLYRITLGGSVFMFCFPDAGDITQFSISREVFQDANTMGHKTYNFEHYKTSSSLECHYLAQYTITADGVSNISFADNTTIKAMKITKVEVYR